MGPSGEWGKILGNLTTPFLSRFPVSGFLHSVFAEIWVMVGVAMGEAGGVTIIKERELLAGPAGWASREATQR